MISPVHRSVIVGALLLAMGCNELIGIGDPTLVGSGAVNGSGAASQGGAGGGGGDAPAPCHPTDPICNQVDSECLALVDNRDKDVFGLRLQQATFIKPDRLVTEQWAAFFFTINLQACNLDGGGTINFLAELNRTTGEVRVGAARHEDDPALGYQFVDQVVMGFAVQPGLTSFRIAGDGTVTTGSIQDLTLPFYLDEAGETIVLVPIHEGRLDDTKLSSDQNCIGEHNDEGLVPPGCLPNFSTGPLPFIEGGKLRGYIDLEEADDVVVDVPFFGPPASLCAQLVYPPDEQYWDTSTPIARCSRSNGQINFWGDWCASTNQPGTPACHDALAFEISFAASAVKINE